MRPGTPPGCDRPHRRLHPTASEALGTGFQGLSCPLQIQGSSLPAGRRDSSPPPEGLGAPDSDWLAPSGRVLGLGLARSPSGHAPRPAAGPRSQVPGPRCSSGSGTGTWCWGQGRAGSRCVPGLFLSGHSSLGGCRVCCQASPRASARCPPAGRHQAQLRLTSSVRDSESSCTDVSVSPSFCHLHGGGPAARSPVTHPLGRPLQSGPLPVAELSLITKGRDPACSRGGGAVPGYGADLCTPVRPTAGPGS